MICGFIYAYGLFPRFFSIPLATYPPNFLATVGKMELYESSKAFLFNP